MTDNKLDFAAIAAHGFDVYVNPDPRWQTYCFFSDGVNVGYVQNSGPFGGATISTVNVPNRSCGTGFNIGDTDLTKESLSRAFAYAPHWASSRDCQELSKYRDMEDFLKSKGKHLVKWERVEA